MTFVKDNTLISTLSHNVVYSRTQQTQLIEFSSGQLS